MNNKTRRVLQIIIIIFALLVLAWIISQSKLPDSADLPLVDSGSNATAWLDSNGDGDRDSSEPPLQGVCIWSDTSPNAYNDTRQCRSSLSYTDEYGEWPGDFFAGSSGDDIYIFTKAPPGYRSTTPPAVHSTEAEFGFAPQSVAVKNPIGFRYDYVKDAIQKREAAFIKYRNEDTIIGISIFTVLIGVCVFLYIRNVRSVKRNKRNK
jgi:hypothetical protein